jgi:hypothetical protein
VHTNNGIPSLLLRSRSTIEHTRMQQRARAYQIVDIDLYKTSISGPLLRCVSKAEGQKILSKIHVGIYEGYIGPQARFLLASSKRRRNKTGLHL